MVDGGGIAVLVRKVEPQAKLRKALHTKSWRTLLAFLSGLLAPIAGIAGRKRLKDERQREAAYLEATFENMSEAIAMVDADLKMVAWNQKFVELFRLPPALTRPGVPFEDIVRFGAELGEFGAARDIDALVRTRMESVKRLEPRQFERKRPDGTVIEVRDRPLPDGGFVALYIDVTERKRAEEARLDAIRREHQAEQRLIEAIDSSSEGIIVYDAEERFVVCNSRYRRFYPDTADLHRPGVKYEDILRAAVARGQFHLSPDVDREAFIQDRLARFRNPGEPIVRQIASGRWVQISERRTPEGGLISVRTDITALKERETELIGSMEAAEAASRAKTAFLANISHELRTPLHAVLGLAEIMRDNPDEAASLGTYREYAKLIHDSGSHLLDLINDVLDMSKIEAGRYDLAEEKLSLISVAEACTAIVGQAAQDRGLQIVNRLDSRLPSVRGDVRAVKQVVLNLLSNAVKFSHAGGAVVISGGRDASGGVTFSVSDTGVGIAAEHLPRITEPFWQGDDSHTRRYEGTGLGLAISKRLMELHGGTIRVQSTKDVGTMVEIWFPPGRVLG